MAAPLPQTIAAYYQSRELHIGLITAVESGLCMIVSETGEAITLNSARLVYSGTELVNEPNPQKAITNFKHEVQNKLSTFAEKDFSFLQTNELNLFQIANEFQLSKDAEFVALYLYLKNHRELFASRKDTFRLKTREEQQAYLSELQAEKDRQDYLQAIRDFVNGGELSNASMDKLYKELPFLAVDKTPKDLYKLITTAYPETSPEEAIHHFRIKCGELPGSVDIAIAESGIPVGWSALTKKEGLMQLSTAEPSCTAFCIDDEDTRDYDDAISIVKNETGWKLGIHVSNVASHLEINGRLFSEAERRISSLYAANYIVPMLPPVFSEGELSLLAGSSRPVISLYLWLDADLAIVSKELCREVISISNNFSYREVDKRIKEEPFALLKQLSDKLNAARESSHSQDKQRYYYYLKEVSGELNMRRIDNLSPARAIVEELMICYNSSVAAIMRDNNIPMLFRNVFQYGNGGDANPASQAYLATQAEFHPGIGAAAYLHGTSPIRRFTDLLNQYQINASLEGKHVPFNTEMLNHAIQHIERRLNLLREIAQKSERYWFLKFIEDKCLHTPLDACIRGVYNGKLRIEILPWGKHVMAVCDSYPASDCFKLVIYAVDLQEWAVKADML